jgi:hypothetical protein
MEAVYRNCMKGCCRSREVGLSGAGNEWGAKPEEWWNTLQGIKRVQSASIHSVGSTWAEFGLQACLTCIPAGWPDRPPCTDLRFHTDWFVV